MATGSASKNFQEICKLYQISFHRRLLWATTEQFVTDAKHFLKWKTESLDDLRSKEELIYVTKLSVDNDVKTIENNALRGGKVDRKNTSDL